MTWTPVASCAALEQGDVRAVDVNGDVEWPVPDAFDDVDLPMAAERML